MVEANNGVELYDLWKKHPHDTIYWTSEVNKMGRVWFSFDGKKMYRLFGDYDNLTPEQKAIFDKENTFWAKFFSKE